MPIATIWRRYFLKCGNDRRVRYVAVQLPRHHRADGRALARRSCDGKNASGALMPAYPNSIQRAPFLPAICATQFSWQSAILPNRLPDLPNAREWSDDGFPLLRR